VLRSRPRNPRGRGAVAKYLAPSIRLRAQDHKQDVHAAHPAELEVRGNALAAAPRAELRPGLLVRHVLEQSVAEQLPGGLEAAVDSDGDSERSESLVCPMDLRISSEPSIRSASRKRLPSTTACREDAPLSELVDV